MRTAILVVAGIAAGVVACSDASSTREVYTPSGPRTLPPPPVATIDVTPNRAAMVPGGRTRLRVSLKDATGVVLSGVPIAWRSSDTTVAAVSDSGDVSALKLGTATISASAESATASSAIVVSPAPVGSVAVSLASSSVQVGGTTQATALVKDSTGAVVTDRAVTWSSSAPSVASVSSSGLVTGLAAGSAVISATSEGKAGSAGVTIATAAPSPVASVSVSLGFSSLTVGSSGQATAVLKDAAGNVLTGRTITWTSSNSGIATVSSSGSVQAVALGSATVTATSEGVSGSAPLTVVAVPVASVTVTLNSSSISVGQSTQANAVIKDASGNVLIGRSIAWKSSNTTVATVSSSGLVQAVAAGSATITATSEGISGSGTITATQVAVASVTVTLNAASLTTGQSTQASAVTKDASGNVLTGRTIAWSSSNTAIATVSSSGLVQAVGAGSASIRGTSEGVTGSASLTVSLAPVASVTLSPTGMSLPVGSTGQITATLKDASGNTLTGRTVTWSSGTPSVATVSASGLVAAVAAGSSTITATSEGVNGSIGVTVTTIVSPGPGVPVYDPTNSTHVLHVFEDWSAYNSARDVGTLNRADGGGPWVNDGAAYQTISTSNVDPWYGRKTLDINYQDAPAANSALERGLTLIQGTPVRYLNASRAQESLIIEWAWRFEGTSYQGKIADWQPYAGTDRFNYQAPDYSPMGAQMQSSCNTDPLCSLYYTNNGSTPKLPGLNEPPSAGTEHAEIARTMFASSLVYYTQNMNYGTGAGQVAWGDSPPGGNMADNTWRRTILRLTLNNGAMGTGRIEEWEQTAGQAPVKVMEYIGDAGAYAAGLVNGRDASQGGNTWLTPSSTLYLYTLTSVGGIYKGGNTTHIGYFRMWSEPRQ